MKHLKLFEAYKDFIGKGHFNTVSEIDDKWVLKMPRNFTKIELKCFNYHINFMKKYTDIFPKVKKLDRYRASIEKLDTKTAMEEIEYISDILRNNIILDINVSRFSAIKQLYNSSDEILNKFKEYGISNNNKLVNKWYEFILKLKITLNQMRLDIHNDNFGLEKDGNIKLIDF